MTMWRTYRLAGTAILGLCMVGNALSQGRAQGLEAVSVALISEDPAAALSEVGEPFLASALDLIDRGHLVQNGASGTPLTSAQVDLLVDHLLNGPAGRATALIRSTHSTDLSDMAAGARMQLFGELGRAQDIEALMALLPESATTRLTTTMERALGALFDRDPLTFARARGLGGNAPLAERVLIRALSATGDVRALQALTPLLIGNSQNLDAALLAVAELARSGVPTDWSIADSARGHLTTPDINVMCAAASLAGAVLDGDSIPELIVLLGHEALDVRRASRRSLQEISGLRHGHDAARWRSWYEVETHWMNSEWPSLKLALDSGDVPKTLGALGVVAAHRLDRRKLVTSVEPLLFAFDERIRNHAARSLGELGVRSAIPSLISALEDPPIQSVALAALVRLTGRRLPPDPQAWRDALGLTP